MATTKNREIFRAVNISNSTTEAEFRSVLLNRLNDGEKEAFELYLHLAPDCINPATQTAIFEFEPRTPNPRTMEPHALEPGASEPGLSELPLFLQTKETFLLHRDRVVAIDADFLGLTQLYPVEPSEIKIDIVALPVPNAHPYRTWANHVVPNMENVAQMWLRDFLCKDDNLKYCRTMIFGYRTKYRPKTELPIEDAANYFLEEINKC
ncbi:hypothetical protein TWF718_000414 [Orbilia javanica]|uniref:Uncharacterized protein n=1 Tax=Orbilia javanica TaxID=47235 RepID=A0AAN8RGE2_9PEZI